MNTPKDSTGGCCPPPPCSAWWLTGWQRKYRTCDNRNDRGVANVFRRLLDSDDRYQRENKMGKYFLPNNASKEASK